MKSQLHRIVHIFVIVGFLLSLLTTPSIAEKIESLELDELSDIYLPIIFKQMYMASTGILDTSFDEDGKAVTAIGGEAQGNAIAIQPDGKIIVAGFAVTTNGFDFTLMRYNPDGSLDATFDGDGWLTTDFYGDDDYGLAVALQTDGKILVAGYTGGGLDPSIDSDFALARYNSNGSLDTTFSGDGKVTTEFFGYSDIACAVAVQSDGKIVLAGGAYLPFNNEFAIARYTPTGALDTTFSGDGKITTDFFGTNDGIFSIAMQADGKIVVAGYTEYPAPFSDYALARYTSTGLLDTTFSNDGKVTTNFDGRFDRGNAIVLQPDGKIIVAGESFSSLYYYFALARYSSNGSLDTGFDIDGKVITDFDGISEGGYGVVLQPDGKIVVAGKVFNSATSEDFALARYNPNGSLDPLFGGDGIVTTDLGGYDLGRAIALQPDGKIVVAGWSDYKFAIVRYK